MGSRPFHAPMQGSPPALLVGCKGACEGRRAEGGCSPDLLQQEHLETEITEWIFCDTTGPVRPSSTQD